MNNKKKSSSPAVAGNKIIIEQQTNIYINQQQQTSKNTKVFNQDINQILLNDPSEVSNNRISDISVLFDPALQTQNQDFAKVVVKPNNINDIFDGKPPPICNTPIPNANMIQKKLWTSSNIANQLEDTSSPNIIQQADEEKIPQAKQSSPSSFFVPSFWTPRFQFNLGHRILGSLPEDLESMKLRILRLARYWLCAQVLLDMVETGYEMTLSGISMQIVFAMVVYAAFAFILVKSYKVEIQYTIMLYMLLCIKQGVYMFPSSCYIIVGRNFCIIYMNTNTFNHLFNTKLQQYFGIFSLVFGYVCILIKIHLNQNMELHHQSFYMTTESLAFLVVYVAPCIGFQILKHSFDFKVLKKLNENQGISEELFLIVESMEAATILFENDQIKYLNLKFMQCFNKAWPSFDFKVLFENNKDLKKLLNFNEDAKITEKFDRIRKTKILRIYKSPQQLETKNNENQKGIVLQTQSACTQNNNLSLQIKSNTSKFESIDFNFGQDEEDDLSINDVLEMDTKKLQEKVFIIMRESEALEQNQTFWQNFDQTNIEGNYRIVQIKKGSYKSNGQDNHMIQLIDISKSILYDQVKAEVQFKELINATVSHEMRNPINSILFQNKNIKFLMDNIKKNFGYLKNEIADVIPKENFAKQNMITHKLKNIKADFKEMVKSQKILDSSSKLLLFFVHDLLDFAQIQSKKFQKHIEKFDIRDAIKELIKMQEFQANSKQIKIRHFYNGFKNEQFVIKTDKRRIQQIILNLISNALKFTDKMGHIDIYSTIKYKQVMKEVENDSFNLEKISREVCIIKVQVKDSGVGISKSDQKKLFKLFGKLKTTNQLNTNGIGLGLCICKSICKVFGGDIRVTSKLNVGSIFAIYFQLDEDYFESIATDKQEEKCKEILNDEIIRLNTLQKIGTVCSINKQVLQPETVEKKLRKYVKVVNPDIKRRLTFNYDLQLFNTGALKQSNSMHINDTEMIKVSSFQRAGTIDLLHSSAPPLTRNRTQMALEQIEEKQESFKNQTILEENEDIEDTVLQNLTLMTENEEQQMQSLFFLPEIRQQSAVPIIYTGLEASQGIVNKLNSMVYAVDPIAHKENPLSDKPSSKSEQFNQEELEDISCSEISVEKNAVTPKQSSRGVGEFDKNVIIFKQLKNDSFLQDPFQQFVDQNHLQNKTLDEKILIVDDQQLNVLALKIILKIQGIQEFSNEKKEDESDLSEESDEGEVIRRDLSEVAGGTSPSVSPSSKLKFRSENNVNIRAGFSQEEGDTEYLRRRIDGVLSGHEAVDKFKSLWDKHKRFYRIIFMDCNMPKMDGYETTRKIREFVTQCQSQREEYPEDDPIRKYLEQALSNEPLIVAVTGHTGEIFDQRAYASGMDIVMGKPPCEMQLREVLECKGYNVNK